MLRPLASLVVRLAPCAVVGGWVWHRAGAMWGPPYGLLSLLPVAVVAGLLGAGPLMALFADSYGAIRQATWREAEGRYYAFKGRRIWVVDVADGHRWIRIADVRAVLGFTASDAALRVTYPDGFALFGRRRVPHLRVEELLVHLRKERTPQASRWVSWLAREVAFPSQRRRERLGMSSDAAAAQQTPLTPLADDQRRMRSTSAVVE